MSIQVLALDSSRPGKFSRHLILRVRAEPCGTPVMLSGPPAAGALARAVVSRLPAEGALVDLAAVYGADRCFRLWGSSKLGAPAGVLALNVSRSSSSAAGLEGELLLRATLVSPHLPRALTLQLGQLARWPHRRALARPSSSHSYRRLPRSRSLARRWTWPPGTAATGSTASGRCSMCRGCM